MPKQTFVINQFQGGLNDEADARDIQDSEASTIDNLRVDKLGELSVAPVFASHVTAGTSSINPFSTGKGLFAWSSDFQNATGYCDDGTSISGTHDGGDNQTALTDSGESWTFNQFEGVTLKNHTSGATGTVYRNTDNDMYTQKKIRIIKVEDDSGVKFTTAEAHGLIANQNLSIQGTVNYNGQYNAATIAVTSDTVKITGTGAPSYVEEMFGADALIVTHLSGATGGGSDNDWDDGDEWRIQDLEHANKGDNYLVYADADSTNGFYIYSHNWNDHSDLFEWGGEGYAEPFFFAADGTLRVADGNFANASTNKWYGYIKRGWFNNPPGIAACANAGQTFDGWYLRDQWIRRPKRNSGDTYFESPLSEWSQDASYNTSNENAWLTVPNGLCGLQVSAKLHDDGLWSGYKKYYYSYIYDGVQESPLRAFDGYDTVYQNSTKRFRLTVNNRNLEIRITGVRVYWQHVTSDEIPEDDVYLLFEANLDLGIKKIESEVYVEWAEQNQYTTRNANLVEYKSEPRTFTYTALSGLQTDETASFCKYKTAVVANRKTYYGNLMIHHDSGDDLTDGVLRLEHKGDAMVKTPVNSFDVMAPSKIIEAVVNDGDEIIKLEEFADRILQFKKHRLYIINVSQDSEFLEATFNHRGIPNQGAAVRTEMGVAFINKNGAFMYDGKQVVNLLEGKVGRRIDHNTWSSFISDDAIIGYDPLGNNLVIRGSSADTVGTNGNCYLFNMNVFAWTKMSDALSDSTDSSNFVNDFDGKLIIKDGTSAIKYLNIDGDATAQATWYSKDIDFKNPGIRKRIYKVYVTYKSGGTVPTMYYLENGQTSNPRSFSGSFSTSQSDWARTEFTASGADTYLDNLYSLRLFFQGTGISGFKINDISIVFRPKRVK